MTNLTALDILASTKTIKPNQQTAGDNRRKETTTMKKINWNADAAAQKMGFPAQLTDGEITTNNGNKIVRFREQVERNGKMGVCCLRIDTRPELAALVSEIEKKETEERKQKAEIEKRTVRIYLSSRGWGEYSSCEWIGDITRSDSEILAECRNRLTTEYDVDQPNQSDDDLLSIIKEARVKWETAPARKAAREAEEKADIQSKIKSGYCFYCETWCHGDCGHYSNDPSVKYRRDFNQAAREANYGIND